MAKSRQQKEDLVDQYKEWIDQSPTFILTEYIGLTVNDIDQLRQKIREAGGEYHIIKNTLGKVAFDSAGLTYPEEYLLGSTAIAFAGEDAPAVAKALSDFSKDKDAIKIKGGYLDKEQVSAAQIDALSSLPPLPVMRAQLLSTILAPANKLVRTLNEPARQIAAVLRSYSEGDSNTAAA